MEKNRGFVDLSILILGLTAAGLASFLGLIAESTKTPLPEDKERIKILEIREAPACPAGTKSQRTYGECCGCQKAKEVRECEMNDGTKRWYSSDCVHDAPNCNINCPAQPQPTTPPQSQQPPPAFGCKKDVTGAQNPACCCSDSDCPSGQVCEIPNGYCRSGTSCNEFPGQKHRECRFDAAQEKNVCTWVPGPGVDNCNACLPTQPPTPTKPLITPTATNTPTPTSIPGCQCINGKLQGDGCDPWARGISCGFSPTPGCLTINAVLCANNHPGYIYKDNKCCPPNISISPAETISLPVQIKTSTEVEKYSQEPTNNVTINQTQPKSTLTPQSNLPPCPSDYCMMSAKCFSIGGQDYSNYYDRYACSQPPNLSGYIICCSKKESATPAPELSRPTLTPTPTKTPTPTLTPKPKRCTDISGAKCSNNTCSYPETKIEGTFDDCSICCIKPPAIGKDLGKCTDIPHARCVIVCDQKRHEYLGTMDCPKKLFYGQYYDQVCCRQKEIIPTATPEPTNTPTPTPTGPRPQKAPTPRGTVIIEGTIRQVTPAPNPRSKRELKFAEVFAQESAVIPFAKVIVTDNFGKVYETIADENGHFKLEVPAGVTYTIRVEAPGFKSAERLLGYADERKKYLTDVSLVAGSKEEKTNTIKINEVKIKITPSPTVFPIPTPTPPLNFWQLIKKRLINVLLWFFNLFH